MSCSVTETQGLTLIEAMASNIPVIARKDRNIETLIQNNVNGRIINTENELSEVIVEILSNKELANNLVLNANKTVEEYLAEQFGLKIESVYNEVLKNYKKVKKKGYRGIKTITKLKNIKSLKSFKYIKKLHAPKAN